MRYLTKSKFKTALSCPTKLYYESHPETYANAKLDDPFLQALAKGGFQVGALAQCYYPGGTLISTRDKQQALSQTFELLQQPNAIIFEAAVLYQNLFIRIDILEKRGNVLRLLEVKSKSVDRDTDQNEIWKVHPLKKGIYEMKSDWQPYIYDVAFQAHVTKLALPEFTVESFLMCPDKNKFTTVDGLNQRFFLTEDNEVQLMGDTSPSALGEEILTRIELTNIIDIVHQGLDLSETFEGRGWHQGIEYLATQYVENKRTHSAVGAKCKQCEFRCESDNKKSGFKECFQKAYPNLTSEDLDQPLVFDLWNFRSEKALEAGKIRLIDLEDDDLPGKNGERQALQVTKVKNQDFSSEIDLQGLAQEFASFRYPLHMIDFETCMVAIPFNKDLHPYQQIAFQFSHHMIQQDGTVIHASESISCTPGVFPNFQFVRELKKSLSQDQGTIFRYSNHENTVLKQIKAQLELSPEPDRRELITFIDSITDAAPRSMVDLCDLAKKYYYSPAMGGSNSIKVVLPAILN